MDRNNTEIGKYKIIEQVGEGAMGVVYRALDPVLNRTVAIKVMSDAIARDDDLRGRFLREAQAAGSLQHPNVVTIYDCGEVDGHLFIAMEFVEGEDLEAVLEKHASLSLIDKIDIIIDVLGGLSYAHKRGIVHRDIKPANIRIDDDGRARIMDFGIAHLSSSNMTRTGVMVGTPAYMAPEQIVGGPITPATDLFSVGAVLYELLTGDKPFQADTLQGVMYKIVSQPPHDLPANGAGIPPEMNAVVLKALAKDPANRYHSATDMANALAELRGGLGRDALASKTISLRSVIDTALADERAAKTRSANRRGVVTGGFIAAGLIGVVLIAVIWNRGRTADATRTPDQGPTPAAATANAQPPTSPAPAIVQSSTTPATASAQQRQVEKSISPGGGTKAAKGSLGSVPPTPQELSLFRSLRATALTNRRLAADAGASPDQLAAGDEHITTADALVSGGKISDAAEHLSAATTIWSSAERDARAGAATGAARQRTSTIDPPAKPQSALVPAPPAVAPAGSSPSVTAPAAASALPSNATSDIRAAVAAYARAIESRDLTEVRRAYPDITAAQATGFEQFFASVRSLHTTFSVSSLEINGSAAEAKLAGEYDYVTNAGKTEKQPVSFQATLRRDGGLWKLASVR